MNIAVLVSGGVDSSVALKLLQEEGHNLTAFYLKIWLEDETAFLGECPWEKDLRYVRAVCEQLDVPLEIVPLQREYYEKVVSYAMEEVRSGRTPNPDVMCNSFVKFGAFLEYADRYRPKSDQWGLLKNARGDFRFDKVATGHYAGVIQETSNKQQETGKKGQETRDKKQEIINKQQETGDRGQETRGERQETRDKGQETRNRKQEGNDNGEGLENGGGGGGGREKVSSKNNHLSPVTYLLRTAKDPVKDQTYFLSRLTQAQLSRACFPLGKFLKSEVREMAKRWNLPTKDRPDSQGLCFLGKINYGDFIRHHLGEKIGDIVNAESGDVVGQHKGYWFHTIGQRHQLGLSGGPWYVTGKDLEKNVVFVSHRLKMVSVERDEFEVGEFRGMGILRNAEHGTQNVGWDEVRNAEHGTQNVGWDFSGDPRSAIHDLHEISGDPRSEFRDLYVKIRHGAQKYACEVEFLDEEKTRLRVKLLDVKERGIAPGQFAVFYDEDVCVGSGVIQK